MVDIARRGWPRVAFSGVAFSGDAEGAFPDIIIPGLMRIGILVRIGISSISAESDISRESEKVMGMGQCGQCVCLASSHGFL
jgi:hypothetical protein